ncbi:MAG: tyrosine recombinase [Candidatus Dependentiae bacterium]|jgi:integrase/recombinase XerD
MKYTDEQYLAQFETYLLTEKRVTENTFDAYQRDVKQLLTFLRENELTVSACTNSDLKLYVRALHKRKVAPRTLARKISALKVFFAYLSEHYAEVSDAAEQLLFPKVDKTLPVYLSEDEVERLLAAAQQDTSPKGVRNLMMLHLLYASGMRISEMVQLKTGQYHPDTGFLSIHGKGNKQRDVPLPHSVCDTMRDYLENTYPKLVPEELRSSQTNYLFASVRKGVVHHMTRQSFWLLLKQLLIKANIKKNVSPHTLRHSLATHLLKAGADVRSLQLLLGHEHIGTVELYTHLDRSQIRRVYDAKHPRA